MRTAIIAIALIIAAVTLGFAGLAGADTIELDLFDFGCPTEFDYNAPYWQTDFDLGVTFTEITNVYIDWSGEITAGLAVNDTDPCNPFPLDVGIRASLSNDPLPRAITETWGWGIYLSSSVTVRYYIRNTSGQLVRPS